MRDQNQVFGVEPVKQKYLDLMGACFYTGKTSNKLQHAVRRGHLKWTIAKDGTKSFEIAELDAYMRGDSDLTKPKVS